MTSTTEEEFAQHQVDILKELSFRVGWSAALECLLKFVQASDEQALIDFDFEALLNNIQFLAAIAPGAASDWVDSMKVKQ